MSIKGVMSSPGIRRAIGWLGVVVALLVVPWVGEVRTLLPSILAIVLVVVWRRAAGAIWVAAIFGLWVSVDYSLGDLLGAGWQAMTGMLRPGGWRFYAVIFTLLMGGFGVMLHTNGCLQAFSEGLMRRFRDRRKGVEWTTFMTGLVCFFDGLASSIITGKVMREPAEKVGLSGAKLSYIVDSTSSSVTCVAFLSTWIAFQLGMIVEGMQLAGYEVNGYAVFFRALPFNFYCWATLLLVAASIHWRIHIGSMGASERRAVIAGGGDDPSSEGNTAGLRWWRMWPLWVLFLGLFGGMYVSGAGWVWPAGWRSLGDAFGAADAGKVLVFASVAGVVAVWLTFPARSWLSRGGPIAPLWTGVRGMFHPVLILLGAWLLGSAMGSLGTAATLVSWIGEPAEAQWIVAIVFLCAALVGFTTGTSWGTIGIMMPLALPMVAGLGLVEGPMDSVMLMTVSAVFGGAVFGDHCSPVSDTTIVAAAACGVDPREHALTQLPYAMICAVVTFLLYWVAA